MNTEVLYFTVLINTVPVVVAALPSVASSLWAVRAFGTTVRSVGMGRLWRLFVIVVVGSWSWCVAIHAYTCPCVLAVALQLWFVGCFSSRCGVLYRHSGVAEQYSKGRGE